WYWYLFLATPFATLLLPPLEPVEQRALLVQFEWRDDIESILRQVPEEHVDLVVLPEYAYYNSPQSVLQSRGGPAALARKVGSPVVFGAVEGEYGKPRFENVAAVIDAEGNLLGTFPKQHPVPLMVDGVPGTRRP